MKIKYSCRGPTDWSKLKLGDRVIIYEGWNIKEGTDYFGEEGTVDIIDMADHLDLHKGPCFRLKYSMTGFCWVYPEDKRKVLGKILN